MPRRVFRFATALLAGALLLAPAASATAAPPATAGHSAASAAAGPCWVGYHIRSSSAVFPVDIVIRNTSGIEINGWTLAFGLPEGQKLVTVRNATLVSAAGQWLTFQDVGWNARVGAAGEVWVHLELAGDDPTGRPSAFWVNGHLCDS